MRKIKLLIATIVFSLFAMLSPVKSYALIGCGASPATMLRIFTESISTLYNVFPISLGGVTINPFGNLPNFESCGNSPVCVCILGTPPIPHIGLTASLWMPTSVIETVKTPFCFPLLGLSIPGASAYLGSANNASHKPASGGEEKQPQNTSDEVHYIEYPIFLPLNLFVAITSGNMLQILGAVGNIGYISEIDPTWKSDMLSTVLDPESILFANPIAQLSCMADSATSAVGEPLDPLFWCMGSYGSTYPVAQQINSFGNVQGSAGLAARTLFHLSRMLRLWSTESCAGICGPIPMPIWIKSEFSYFPVYPGLYPIRIPIGQTGLIWDHAINMAIPTQSDNFDWFMYQHWTVCFL